MTSEQDAGPVKGDTSETGRNSSYSSYRVSSKEEDLLHELSAIQFLLHGTLSRNERNTIRIPCEFVVKVTKFHSGHTTSLSNSFLRISSLALWIEYYNNNNGTVIAIG